MQRKLRLGTRGSPLAMAQARKVAAALETAQRWPADYVEIVPIKTSGDRIQYRPLAEVGGKALWTKELDRALLEGEVDFCVHSMKDVESERPRGIHIAAMRPRGDYRERLIGAESIDALKQGAVVGTSSLRRQAQLRAAGQRVTTVRPGDAFARDGEGGYILNPERGREGYDALIRDLVASGRTPDRVGLSGPRRSGSARVDSPECSDRVPD